MDQNEPLFSLSIDSSSQWHLGEAAKWARFIAIAGMCLLGIFILFAIFGVGFVRSGRAGYEGFRSDAYERSSMIGSIIGVTVIALIGFFPMLFLLQFANKTKLALAANNQQEMSEAFRELKKYLRYTGVITIILLCIYALLFIVGLLSRSSSSF